MSLPVGETMKVLDRIADAGNKIAKAISDSNGKDKRIAELESQLAENQGQLRRQLAEAEELLLNEYAKSMHLDSNAQAMCATAEIRLNRIADLESKLAEAETELNKKCCECFATATLREQLAEAQARVKELREALSNLVGDIQMLDEGLPCQAATWEKCLRALEGKK